MTILELQKRLQEMYEKYGDIEVAIEDTDWEGIAKYHFEVSSVDSIIGNNGNNIVTLSIT